MRRDMAAEVARKVVEEMFDDAGRVAKALFPGVPPGAVRLSREEYLAYVRRNWTDPAFRQALLQRVGPENFLKTARAAFGLTEEDDGGLL